MSGQSAILSMQHLGQYLHLYRQVRIIDICSNVQMKLFYTPLVVSILLL